MTEVPGTNANSNTRIIGKGKSVRFLVLIFIAAILVSVGAIGADIKSVQSGDWSDPDTWNAGVPGQGDNVLVDSGHAVLYDVHSDEEIRLIHIRGQLIFSRSQDTQLDAGMIILTTSETVDENGDCSLFPGGPQWSGVPLPALEVGTIDNPIPEGITATIRLEYFSGMDDDCAPGIINYIGRMDFHGVPMTKTWVKLGANADAGDNTITLAETVDWKAGDHIIITRSTRPNGNIVNTGSYKGNGQRETEERYITAISGNTITLDEDLDNDHPWHAERAGEVAVLNRNVVVESKDPDGERGHTMYHYGSLGSISYAEFRHLGKEGVLARYPIHFHVLKNTNRGGSVIGASVWDSDNRFVTIHGTNYLVVRDCVGYKSEGHGYFMEDATEIYNFLDHNLAVQTFNRSSLPNQALPYDDNDGAGFWWANGRNAFLNNVATETDKYGYEFDIPADIYAPVLQPNGSTVSMQINELPFILFKGNETHGSMEYGLNMVDAEAPVDDPFIIEDFKAWHCWRAVRPDVDNFYVKNLYMYDHAYGFYGKNNGAGRIEGVTGIDVGNTAFGFQDAPEGLITIEDVYIDTANEHPWDIKSEKERDEDCNIHVRNYTLVNITNSWDGARASGSTKDDPEMNLYLHDYFGPGQDAKVIPEEHSRNDGLNYEDMSPDFDGTVKVAETSVDWPSNPIHLNDDLPPATVIIFPQQLREFPDNTTEITVRGTCIDASEVDKVYVNDVEATPVADNFRQWEVTLSGFTPGNSIPIEAYAVDEHGNTEITRHKVTIGIGSPAVTGLEDEEPLVSENYQLLDNYPNPFNPETNIRFTVSAQTAGLSNISIVIYNVLGHKVRTLSNESLSAGQYVRTWDGRDDRGQQVASGVYIYEMIAGAPGNKGIFKDAKKMLLVR